MGREVIEAETAVLREAAEHALDVLLHCVDDPSARKGAIAALRAVLLAVSTVPAGKARKREMARENGVADW